MKETRINSKTTFVEYKASPRAEGLVYLWLAAALGLFSTLFLIFGDLDATDRIVAPVIAYGATVWIAAFGAYYRYFRRKPLKRSVILGNHMHRMYLRSRVLFLIYTLLLCTVIYVVTVLLIDFISCGFAFDIGRLMDDFIKGQCLLLLFGPYKAAMEYLGYRQYYICLNIRNGQDT